MPTSTSLYVHHVHHTRRVGPTRRADPTGRQVGSARVAFSTKTYVVCDL